MLTTPFWRTGEYETGRERGTVVWSKIKGQTQQHEQRTDEVLKVE